METLEISRHPCFNAESRHQHMRIHLPVAPRCNVQCQFCTRKFDCVNESRPGVTEAVLSPQQALWYLEKMAASHPQLAVVGIAGPGDPFANTSETLETLRLVRAKFPNLLLCLATNGLGLLPSIPELGRLRVSHVSITINAVDPAIVEKIYAWVRYDKHVLTGRQAAERILENQLAAIPLLKQAGIVVKINTVVMAGVNDHHVTEVARRVKALGADLLNPMAMYANAEAGFGADQVPSPEMMRGIKREVEALLPVMHHCTRCRADAAGFLGEPEKETDRGLLREAALQTGDVKPETLAVGRRQYVAVATREGLLVNQHLGEASELWIYGMNGKGVKLIGKRPTPPAGLGEERWRRLAESLQDCAFVLVSGAGNRPEQVLSGSGLTVYRMEGMIEEITAKVLSGQNVCQYLIGAKRCGEACQGTGTGCG